MGDTSSVAPSSACASLGTSRSRRPSSSFTSARPTGSRSTAARTATSIANGAKVEPVVGDIRRVLQASGIDIEACNVEHGPAQIEINLGHGHPSRWPTRPWCSSTPKQTALAHGLRATFMPKPYATEAGNGFHIHQNLLDSDGQNAFEVGDDEPPHSRR